MNYRRLTPEEQLLYRESVELRRASAILYERARRRRATRRGFWRAVAWLGESDVEAAARVCAREAERS